MHMIDMRSDTITKPTPAMREAMARAEVGDDVFGDDPTVNALQDMAAARLGKEAGLYVASGTMGNLVSLLALCGRGDEVITGDQAHTYYYEQAGMAALGGIQPRLVRNQHDGTLDLSEVEAAIRGDDIHFPRTRLVTVENTQNRMGGVPLSPAYMHALGELVRAHGLRLHIDGARIFNAAVALGVDVKELVHDADSVTICLSKGLAAPVGSVVCGSREFIREARRARKVVGGGMRQAGVIAAAGIVALDQMVDRLSEDHANAAALADGLRAVPGISVEDVPCRTNILYFALAVDALGVADFLDQMAARGIRMLGNGPRRVRAVLNYHISRADVEATIAAASDVLKG